MEAMHNNKAAAREHTIFGVSITNKGRLAMRSTSEDKYAARLQVFARDGDQAVFMVNLKRVLHKSAAAAELLNSAWFIQQCVAVGHNREQLVQFLTAQAGRAAAVPVMPAAMPAQTEPQAAQLPEAQEPAVQDAQEPAVQAAAQSDTTEPDITALLEQQESADAAEEPEESVESSRKQRRRR